MWVLGIGVVELGSGLEFSALRKMNIFHPYLVVVLGVCPDGFSISAFCFCR